jgi:hypothetical protein
MDFSYDFVLKMVIGDSLIPNHENKLKKNFLDKYLVKI